jgi:hypothetical protein
VPKGFNLHRNVILRALHALCMTVRGDKPDERRL